MTRKRTNEKAKSKSTLKKTNLKYGLILSAILIIAAGSIIALTSQDGEPSEKSWGDAPDFTLKTFEGDDFTLSDHLGKVVVIDLMAVRCPPCETQMVYLDELNYEVGDEIVIISIDVDGAYGSETEQQVRNKYGDYVEKWTFAMDTYEESVGSKEEYQTGYIPTIVIINTEGDVSYKSYGAHPKETLLEEINKANM